jgi:hypothetical protein
MTDPRCYTVAQILERLQLSRRTFARQRKAGALPFLEELHPRIGRRPRYRAEPIDRYLTGEWGRPSLVFGRKRGAR